MNLKKRIAVCLCMLLVLPTLLGSLPSLTLQANAAGRISGGTRMPWSTYTYGDGTGWEATNCVMLEVGQEVDFSSYFCYYNNADYSSHYFSEITGDSYKSSAASVVSVSKEGVVKAIKKGTATITVKYKELMYKVNVKVVSKNYTTRKDIKKLNQEMASLWKDYGNKKITSKNVIAVYNKLCDLRKIAIKCNSALGVSDTYPAILGSYVRVEADNSYRILMDYGKYEKIREKLTSFACDKKTSIVATVSTKNLTAKSAKVSNKTITVNFNKAVNLKQLTGAFVSFGKYDNKISEKSGVKLNYCVYKGKKLNVFNYYKKGTMKEKGTITLKPGSKKVAVKLKKKLAKGDYFIGFYPENAYPFYSLSFSKAFKVK